MIRKRVTVVNGVTGEQTPLSLASGVTPAEIIRQLNLPENFQLARVQDRKVLPAHSDAAGAVEDGERVFTFMRIEVGIRHECIV